MTTSPVEVARTDFLDGIRRITHLAGDAAVTINEIGKAIIALKIQMEGDFAAIDEELATRVPCAQCHDERF